MHEYKLIIAYVLCRPYAGTPLARISHRELIDKLYEFLTAFLQLRYELSVMSMRSLWGLDSIRLLQELAKINS